MIIFPNITFFLRYESQNSAFALEYWVKQGMDRSKLNLGIPFYGQTFQLANPGQSGLYAPVVGPGDAGPITQQRGMLSYMEMCQRSKFKKKCMNIVWVWNNLFACIFYNSI